MKYRLKDICSITKGATGIMKADGGKYPLVALSDERRSHSEFQFDANAVIVPLISSTGHGHASMKRVHYQEGKFALGNILCAVIPNDEKQLNAKYLHLYLHQFKETLLVPLMKGAANVSLPMNKLSDIEIEVPSLGSQLQIIALEVEAAKLKNDLEVKLKLQDGDVTKLRQAILEEAMQGKLVKQDSSDESAGELLKRIKTQKAKSGKKEKSLPHIKPNEIPFEFPENWVLCRLGEMSINLDGQRKPISQSERNGRQKIYDYYGASGVIDKIDGYTHEGELLLIGEDGANLVARSTPIAFIAKGKFWVNNHAHVIETVDRITLDYLSYYINSIDLKSSISGGFQPKLSQGNLNIIPIPLPPISEQHRIVKKIEQLMQLCDELQYSIQQSKIENEKLLQGALRDAIKKEEVVV